MNERSFEDFLAKNEIAVNRLVANVVAAVTFCFPLLMLGKLVGIFSNMSYARLLVYYGVSIAIVVALHFLAKYKGGSALTRCLCMVLVETIVILLSLDSGFELFLAYVLVPLASCLYFRPKFTVVVSFFCYVLMIASVCIRGFADDPLYELVVSPEKWIMVYALGLTIEFLLNVLCLYSLTRLAQKNLYSVFERNQKLTKMRRDLVNSFANLIESKDRTTGRHAKRVCEYVGLIARKLRESGLYLDELDDDQIERMVLAAPLHDLGMLSVPDELLRKTGRLTPQEYSLFQSHTIEGNRLIVENMQSIEEPEYIMTARYMALFHHEHWNGTGYPFRLVENEIPLAARIMTAADILDSLLTEQPNKRAYSLEESLSIIHDIEGNCLEPCIAQALLKSSAEIAEIHARG